MKTLLKENGWTSIEDSETTPKQSIIFESNQLIILLNKCREAIIELGDFQEGWEDDLSEVEDILALIEESDFDPELS